MNTMGQYHWFSIPWIIFIFISINIRVNMYFCMILIIIWSIGFAQIKLLFLSVRKYKVDYGVCVYIYTIPFVYYIFIYLPYLFYKYGIWPMVLKWYLAYRLHLNKTPFLILRKYKEVYGLNIKRCFIF